MIELRFYIILKLDYVSYMELVSIPAYMMVHHICGILTLTITMEQFMVSVQHTRIVKGQKCFIVFE